MDESLLHRAGSYDARRKSCFVGALILLTAALAGCGEGEDASAGSAPPPAGTGSALLTWTPPLQNSDGTALMNLTGYRIYWGTSPGNYSNSVTIGANLSSYVVEQLAPARYYFVATALSATGESAYSNEATKVVN